jgi:hypothetical protein
MKRNANIFYGATPMCTTWSLLSSTIVMTSFLLYPGAAAGIFGCNSGRETHAARTSSSYVDINGYEVFGDGSVLAPGMFPAS